jgi:hypothetical protein
MKNYFQFLLAALVAFSLTACGGGSPEAQLTGNTYKFESFTAGEGMAEMKAAEQAKIDQMKADTAVANTPEGMAEIQMAEMKLNMMNGMMDMLVQAGATIKFVDDKSVEFGAGGKVDKLDYAYPFVLDKGKKAMEVKEVTAEGITVAVLEDDKPIGDFKLTKVAQ